MIDDCTRGADRFAELALASLNVVVDQSQVQEDIAGGLMAHAAGVLTFSDCPAALNYAAVLRSSFRETAEEQRPLDQGYDTCEKAGFFPPE
jgi:hypothetical protein